MVTEFIDAIDVSVHDKFQSWRTTHQDGFILTLKTRALANLHSSRCKHFGNGPPYFLMQDSFVSLTKKRKVCGLEEELLAWATARGISVKPCHDCLNENLIGGGQRQRATANIKLAGEFGDTPANIIARAPTDDFARIQSFANTLVEDLKSIALQKIDATTKSALVNARIGQGLFRSQVFKVWGNCCAVTGSTTIEAIRASHIKPWRSCQNEERLDAHNGLPLIASLDALFDAGLISFDLDGKMLVSNQLNPSERSLFSTIDRSLKKKPTHATTEYLCYHRQMVFRK